MLPCPRKLIVSQQKSLKIFFRMQQKMEMLKWDEPLLWVLCFIIFFFITYHSSWTQTLVRRDDFWTRDIDPRGVWLLVGNESSLRPTLLNMAGCFSTRLKLIKLQRPIWQRILVSEYPVLNSSGSPVKTQGLVGSTLRHFVNCQLVKHDNWSTSHKIRLCVFALTSHKIHLFVNSYSIQGARVKVRHNQCS